MNPLQQPSSAGSASRLAHETSAARLLLRSGTPLLVLLLGLVVTAGLVLRFRQPVTVSIGTALADEPAAQPASPVPAPRYVAALGRIQPQGDVRRLAGTTSGAGNARIARLLVKEGAVVAKGQLLAIFDNNTRLEADLRAQQAQVETLTRRLELSRSELLRYEQLVEQGAVTRDSVNQRRQNTEQLAGEWSRALAVVEGIQADLRNSILVAPMDGTVLVVHAREGERPGEAGVLELGQINAMEVVAEVYEADVHRVRIGQSAVITTEHGGFDGELKGAVKQVGYKVNRRDIFSTNPTADVDSRVVEVRIALDPTSSQRVATFSRMQVLARIEVLSTGG